jgi:hypothetical protein
MASTIKRPIATTVGANPRSGPQHPPITAAMRKRRRRIIGDDHAR